jgi:HAD superfamily hydrolase (TIGR01509 family)
MMTKLADLKPALANGNRSALPDFSAIIFDMDGLVLDTESTYCQAWRQAAEVMGYVLSEAFCRSLSGLHYQAVEAKLQAVCGAGFDPQVFNRGAGECWRNHVQTHGIPVKHGFVELLAYLRQQQVPVALATNSRAVNAQECLELAGLHDAFAVRVTRDDVASGKPAPDIFLQAAARLDVPVNQCWVLEDSYTGIVAAKRAGAFPVLIPSLVPADTQAVSLCGLMQPDLACLLATIRAEFPYR